MAKKIYKAGAFLIVEDTVNGTLFELNSSDVQIKKENTNVDQYNIIDANGQSVLKVNLSEIVDVNGDAYIENDWNTFRFEQVGAQNTTDVSITTGYTETTINVSSADILAMGTTPIELLPASGAGNYYDIDKIIFEYNHNTTAYTSTSDQLTIRYSGDDFGYISASSIKNSYDTTSIVKMNANSSVSVANTPVVGFYQLNGNLSLETFDGDDPALGDGTFIIKVYHKTLNFG